MTDRVHHHPALCDDHRWAVGAALGLYIAAAVTVLLVGFARTTIQPIDDGWLEAMIAIEAGPLTFVAKIFNVVGGRWLMLPIRIGITAYLGTKRRFEQLTIWVVAWVFSDLAVGALKALYGRDRPLDPLVSTTNSAFPSGHAVAGAVTAVALVIVLLPAGAHRRIWAIVAGIFAFLMAMSRTYLRAHWLSDVVVGALLGSATAIAGGAIIHFWWTHNRLELPEGGG